MHYEPSRSKAEWKPDEYLNTWEETMWFNVCSETFHGLRSSDMLTTHDPDIALWSSRWCIWTCHGTSPRCMPGSIHCQNLRQVRRRWEAWWWSSEVPYAHVWAPLISLQLLLEYKHAFCSCWCLLEWYHDFCMWWCPPDMSLWLGTFEHEFVNLGCWRSWLSVWALHIWWMRWLHENVVAGATFNRGELLPQTYAVWAMPAQPSELTVVCTGVQQPLGICWLT